MSAMDGNIFCHVLGLGETKANYMTGVDSWPIRIQIRKRIWVAKHDTTTPRRCLLPLRSRLCPHPHSFLFSLFFFPFFFSDKSCRISPILGDAILTPLYTGGKMASILWTPLILANKLRLPTILSSLLHPPIFRPRFLWNPPQLSLVCISLCLV